MSQLRQRESELSPLGLQPLVVTFDGDSMAQTYVNETRLSWPLLLDPDFQTYQRYGMDRGSWWDLYNPGSIFKYLKLILGGQRPGKPGKDWHQLGGDVLVDPEGRVAFSHASQNPHDRPSVDQLLAVIQSSSSAG